MGLNNVKTVNFKKQNEDNVGLLMSDLFSNTELRKYIT